MSKILLLYVLSLCTFVTMGQSDYISYHKTARLIESKILDSSYAKAVILYQSLFSEYDFVFAEDCFRAAQTATIIDDTTQAFRFLDRAVIQGVTKERILMDSVLNDLKQSKLWSKFEQDYDDHRNQYRSKINWDLRQRINDLYDLDQKYRDKHELHPLNILWRPLIWAKWKKVTTKIVTEELMPLVKIHGFPNEQLIGLDEAIFHQKQRYDHLQSNYAFFVLIHYYSVPRPTDFNLLLSNGIKTGHIHPRQYASLIDFQAIHGKDKYYHGLHYNEWGGSKDSSEFDQINTNRLDIGLESIETRSKIYQRALQACREIKKGNYQHIRFWLFCG